MFLFHSTHHGSFRHRCSRNVFAFVALSLLLTALLFTGCGDGGGTPTESRTSLDGTWKSEYDELFIINLTAKTYSNPADGAWGDYSLNGNIKEIVTFNSSGSAGIIYIEITSKGNYFSTSGTGNFTGVHFINLTDTTVEISTAADAITYKTPVYSTLADAKSALNENSVQMYFAMISACAKQ